MVDKSLITNSQMAAMQRAEAWCVAAERCSRDVFDHLKQWGVEPADAAQIVQWLEEEGYVDDARYAQLYCESKVAGHGWGRQKVAFNLRNKGISGTIIGNALEAIDEEVYFDAAAKAAKAKWKALSALTPDKRMLRTKAFLAQRGFTMQEIYQTIKNLNFK